MNLYTHIFCFIFHKVKHSVYFSKYISICTSLYVSMLIGTWLIKIRRCMLKMRWHVCLVWEKKVIVVRELTWWWAAASNRGEFFNWDILFGMLSKSFPCMYLTCQEDAKCLSAFCITVCFRNPLWGLPRTPTENSALWFLELQGGRMPSSCSRPSCLCSTPGRRKCFYCLLSSCILVVSSIN